MRYPKRKSLEEVRREIIASSAISESQHLKELKALAKQYPKTPPIRPRPPKAICYFSTEVVKEGDMFHLISVAVVSKEIGYIYLLNIDYDYSNVSNKILNDLLKPLMLNRTINKWDQTKLTEKMLKSETDSRPKVVSQKKGSIKKHLVNYFEKSDEIYLWCEDKSQEWEHFRSCFEDENFTKLSKHPCQEYKQLTKGNEIVAKGLPIDTTINTKYDTLGKAIKLLYSVEAYQEYLKNKESESKTP